MIDSKFAIEGPAAHSPEWYQIRSYDPERERPVVITASEAAAACNASPYSSALELYLTKRGEMEAWQPDDEQAERMRFGHRMEEILIDEYKSKNECEVQTDLPMFLSTDVEYMGATPDGIAKKASDIWELEAKNSNWRMFDSSGEDEHKYGRAGTDEVPAIAMFQAQQQMKVLGLNRVEFPVLKNGNEMLVYKVDRNDALIEQIVEAEAELVQRIIDGKPPEPNFEHAGTAKLLKELYGVNVGSVVELTADDEALWFRQMEIAEEIKNLESEKRRIKNEMLSKMGDFEIAKFPGRNFQLKRTIVADSYWTEKDVRNIVIGEVKRSGHVRLTKSKAKG